MRRQDIKTAGEHAALLKDIIQQAARETAEDAYRMKDEGKDGTKEYFKVEKLSRELQDLAYTVNWILWEDQTYNKK